jgi:hypothetical protein
MPRPFGVTLLAVLSLASGLLSMLKALVWLGLGGALAGVSALVLPAAGAVIGGLALFFGGIALVTGLCSLWFAWGAWGLRPWAWSFGVWTHATILIWSILAVLGPWLLSERWLDIAISGTVLFYLTSKPIKLAFGKA